MATQIRDRLTITNDDAVKSIAHGDYGSRDLETTMSLWRDEGSELVMPRGFAAELRMGLGVLGHKTRWVDETSLPSLPLSFILGLKQPVMRDYQERAAIQIYLHRQGVLQAGTGSGKTVIGLECFRRFGTPGLVIVDKTGLADQWIKRCEEHLGFTPGMIGDGQWEEKPLTIAMIKTLAARRAQLDMIGFWQRWGLTIVDEAHHAAAQSFMEILQRTVSRYMVGKTATPLEGDWYQPILLNMIGPIMHVVSEQELRHAGARVVPLIKVVRTNFSWKPVKAADKRLVDSRAIYRRVIDALRNDADRLDKIVNTIIAQPEESAQLVVCDDLAYLDKIRARLCELGYPDEDVFFMRGKEKKERRTEVAEIADEGHCVILATVADEGVDIKRLDRLHLVWPGRRELKVTQKVGRILRKHPNKREAIVFDYVDFNQGVLRSQFYSRRNVYVKAGYPIDGLSEPAAT